MVFIPFKDYRQLYKTTIFPIINAQWFVYIIISSFFIKSNYENSLRFKWQITVTIAVLIIWAYFTFISFEYFVGGSIIFSTIFYLSFLFFLINKKISSKVFEKRKVIKNINISKETEKSIEQLISYMVSEKPYKNPDLKLADVAQNLDISSHELSKLINENLQISFTEFINKYRVEEAKLLITTKSNYTIEGIGNISGFNSKSAFYKAFKIHTGTTPSKYESKISSLL
ncbi:helix-turn-helix domain-containing protein [Yeosuana sp.]